MSTLIYPTKFLKIIQEIKLLKIQGAEAVAIAGKDALNLYYQYIMKEKHHPIDIYSKLKSVVSLISSTRPTEPMLRNVLKYLLYQLDTSTPDNFKKDFNIRIKQVNEHIKTSKKNIIKFGKHKLKSVKIVFTHCHSSTVTDIIINSKVKVKNTETRPLFQGRKTAKELLKKNISVEHFVDSGAKIAIKNSDIVLFGADAITSSGVYNKIGSEMFAIVAKHYDKPVYICADSWKLYTKSFFGFDEVIEKRHSKEVWPNKPKNLHINNFAFEKINLNLISGIISELGVYPVNLFMLEAIEKYPFLKL